MYWRKADIKESMCYKVYDMNSRISAEWISRERPKNEMEGRLDTTLGFHMAADRSGQR